MNPGRNDPCPCGSGRKFKQCCGSVAALVAAPVAVSMESLIDSLNKGRPAEAEQRASALLRTRLDDGLLWKILSVSLIRQDKDALPALRRAAELLPSDAEAHANLGGELAARKDWAGALVSLRKSLSLDSRNPDVLILAADAQQSLGSLQQAVEIYRQALAMEPRRADGHNNLGNTLLLLGDAAAAASSYKTALALRPKDAQILCNLGNALRQLGELEDAAKCTHLALELAPGLSMAHNNMGLLLAARGERDAAIACYREALRHRPNYAEALTNLGHALLESRRIQQAVDHFRQALALQPEHVRALLGLAAAQRVQGLASEALSNCERALNIAPQNLDALLLLGELRADGGQFAQAQALFQQVLVLDPKFTPAYCSIASHRRMTRDDSAWLQGAQSLLDTRLTLSDETDLHYALGKYFDETGAYDAGFGHYKQANELSKRSGGPYDAARLTALVDRIIDRCDAAFVARAALGASDSEEPVFIVGMPRSGTSLAEQILASHPSVTGAGEVAFWDQAFTHSDDPQLAQSYLQRLRGASPAALRVTDKMPANFFYAGLIHSVLPRARIIHMQRHPLDTCLSVYFQNFFNFSPYANDLSHLAHYYSQYLRIMAHWRQVLPAHALLEVPYEELVQHPEPWTRRMLDFVGLPWDPRCLQFHETQRTVITASKWQVRQKMNTGSVGRWRNYAKYLEPLRHLAPGEEPV